MADEKKLLPLKVLPYSHQDGKTRVSGSTRFKIPIEMLIVASVF